MGRWLDFLLCPCWGILEPAELSGANSCSCGVRCRGRSMDEARVTEEWTEEERPEGKDLYIVPSISKDPEQYKMIGALVRGNRLDLNLLKSKERMAGAKFDFFWIRQELQTGATVVLILLLPICGTRATHWLGPPHGQTSCPYRACGLDFRDAGGSSWIRWVTRRHPIRSPLPRGLYLQHNQLTTVPEAVCKLPDLR